MTILNTIEYDWSDVIIFIIASLIVTIAAAGIMCNSILQGLVIGVIITIVLSCIVIPTELSDAAVRYEVIFDDDVKLNDILDKYEIIDQSGNIYTIKEKTTWQN